MKKLSVAMLLLCISFAFAKPQFFERQMAQYVHQDKDWLQYVCGDEACSVAQMQRQLEFETVTICTHPDTIKAAIVEPKNKANNFFTALFVWEKGKPVPRIHFFGRGLGLDRDLVDSNGCRYVIGSERLGANEYNNYRFQWIDSDFERVAVTDYDTPLRVQPFIEKPQGTALLHPALGKCYADLQSFVYEQFGCMRYSIPYQDSSSKWVNPEGCESTPSSTESDKVSLEELRYKGDDSKWTFLINEGNGTPFYYYTRYEFHQSPEGKMCFLLYTPCGENSEITKFDKNRFPLQKWFDIGPSKDHSGWRIEYRYDKKRQYFIPAKCVQLDGDKKGRRTKESEYPCESPVQ